MTFCAHSSSALRPLTAVIPFARGACAIALAIFPILAAQAGQNPGVADYKARIQPLLQNYCFDCHGDGAHKGDVAFDEMKSDQQILTNRDLWLKALKNVRAGMMPPAKKPQPTPEEKLQLAQWIKTSVFNANPDAPDPGHVTIRRLNRVEYHNTIRDLMGISYDTQLAFPPDDTGYGFDTIGDVLTISPMLLEKYLNAAQQIVAKAVPEKLEGSDSKAYRRFFPRNVPETAKERRAYAREVISSFAQKAFRRPVDTKTVNRLADMAEDTYSRPGKSFESGIADAMVAVLASPRFVFREEATKENKAHPDYPLVDEFSLASRLSYFLWSTMPDEDLMREAAAGTLRANLTEELRRMLTDKRSKDFVRNFTGQWLKARDVENIQIEDSAVLQRERGNNPEMEKVRHRYHELDNLGEERRNKEEEAEYKEIKSTFFKRFAVALTPALSSEMRRAMRDETEQVFSYVIKDDRSLIELIDSDYTFLNEKLAHQYGITNVTGSDMRRVTLPPNSPRGGILTEGTVLVVTSNPTRTSPVKRGLFILDNVLGTPPPPPPPNIPSLEDALKSLTNGTPTLRQTLAAHRASPMCASCHNRMDPLGLAMENFDALGLWRTNELKQPIDVAGTLLTGESFGSIQELKHALAKKHAEDFYRTLTEKMLTYALGRGLEYYDVETVDQIVARIKKADGRPSALLAGIVESAPFQECRAASAKSISAR